MIAGAWYQAIYYFLGEIKLWISAILMWCFSKKEFLQFFFNLKNTVWLRIYSIEVIVKLCFWLWTIKFGTACIVVRLIYVGVVYFVFLILDFVILYSVRSWYCGFCLHYIRFCENSYVRFFIRTKYRQNVFESSFRTKTQVIFLEVEKYFPS